MRKTVLAPDKLSQREKAMLEKLRNRLVEARNRRQGQAPVIRIEIGGKVEDLPEGVAKMIADTLSEMAEGTAIQVTAIPEELTTTQVAELLNVPRPFVVRLLDEGKLPHRLLCSHRRVLREDVLAYGEAMKRKSRKAAEELVRQAQELDMDIRGNAFHPAPGSARSECIVPDDRHVLAAAITAEADAILTFNTRDFPNPDLEPYGIVALHPDIFLSSLFHEQRDAFLEVVRALRHQLVRPPVSAEAYIERMRICGLPALADRLAVSTNK